MALQTIEKLAPPRHDYQSLNKYSLDSNLLDHLGQEISTTEK